MELRFKHNSFTIETDSSVKRFIGYVAGVKVPHDMLQRLPSRGVGQWQAHICDQDSQ